MGRRKQWANDSSVTINLKAGGSVSLTFQGNFFDLTSEEQQLMSDLRKIIHGYHAAPEPEMMAAETKQP